MAGFGEKSYRAKQVFTSLYSQKVKSLDQITTLPLALRERMAAEGFEIGLPRIAKKFVSVDGTIRYLIEMADGLTVETVWMPEGDGGEAGDGSEAGQEEAATEAAPFEVDTAGIVSEYIGETEKNLERVLSDAAAPDAILLLDEGDALFGKRTQIADAHDRYAARENAPARPFRRATICVSSQVGCAVDCKFCLTATLGVKRNLTAGEIAGQVIAVLNDHGVAPPETRINLVFMGMGEPFLNYANFMQAVRVMVEGVQIPASRMTVSTSGIVPRIEEFSREPIRPKLAISLNASNEAARTEIMPITKKWTVEKLLAAARAYPLKPREWVTFEYVLLNGVNDGLEHARELVQLLKGINCKVNLIALNPGPGIAFQTPEPEKVAAFQQLLIKSGVPTYVRRPRGRDIYAACGQLKRTEELVGIDRAS
jgi:23S rRNA (adenine2503-C2)-methyltransferase